MPSPGPVKVSADSLLEWLEALSIRPIVRQLPDVHDAILTAIADIRSMTVRGAADQARVDELFRDIVNAIGKARRID